MKKFIKIILAIVVIFFSISLILILFSYFLLDVEFEIFRHKYISPVLEILPIFESIWNLFFKAFCGASVFWSNWFLEGVPTYYKDVHQTCSDLFIK